MIPESHKKAMQTYIDAFNKGDLEGILSLFSEKAKIYSPTQAEPKAPGDFYPALLERSRGNTHFTLKRVFSSEIIGEACMWFDYNKTTDKGTVTFDCVDICSFDPQGKIDAMRIVFDTKKLGL